MTINWSLSVDLCGDGDVELSQSDKHLHILAGGTKDDTYHLISANLLKLP